MSGPANDQPPADTAAPTYGEARTRARSAIRDMATHPGRPPLRAKVELDILEMAMPHVHKYLHNHKYREEAVKEAADIPVSQMYPQKGTLGVHGADAAADTRDLIEVKTQQMASRNIGPNTGVGVFDKVHARVDPPEEMSSASVWAALSSALGPRAPRDAVIEHLASGNAVIPSTTGTAIQLGTSRRVARLVALLDAADVLRSTGLSPQAPSEQALEWPAMVNMNGVARYKHTCFGLFEKTSPRPLLVIHMPSDELENSLGDRFEDAASRLHRQMSEDRNGKGASPRDSFDVKMSDLMRRGTRAKIVWVDFERMDARNIRFTGEAAAWASSRNNTYDREMAERIATTLCAATPQVERPARATSKKVMR